MPQLESITIATRKSELALWQARFVQQALETHYPGLHVQLLGLSTRGDEVLDRSLSKIGGKGLFVKELEQALLDGRADFAVHSVKDIPMRLPSGMLLAAIMSRDDPRDAIVGPVKHLGELGKGSVVGTSSLRRQSQILARYPDLQVRPLRGNLQTRLRKLDEGSYDAIILAAAGLKRLNLEARISAFVPLGESLPALGQGALGMECLAKRRDVVRLLEPINHDLTARCIRAERALGERLNASCQVPLGGYAECHGKEMTLKGFVARPDGSLVIAAEMAGETAQPEWLGIALAEELIAQGAAAILSELEP
ncbi:MAG: hydroxymethylbilane synthase [Proteobacteria bacterium]|nr:hydroxymethylbilane synthase [Pseudomonadota bacterium]